MQARQERDGLRAIMLNRHEYTFQRPRGAS